MNDLSFRPGPWINYTNNQATVLPSDYISFSQQPTLSSNPNRLAQYVITYTSTLALTIIEIAFISPRRGLPFIEVTSGFEYIVEEINVLPTVTYLNEIVLGGEALSWHGRALHMTFALFRRYRKVFECPTLSR